MAVPAPMANAAPMPLSPATPIASPVASSYPSPELPVASVVDPLLVTPVPAAPAVEDSVDLVVCQASPLVLKNEGRLLKNEAGEVIIPEQLDLEGERQALLECLGWLPPSHNSGYGQAPGSKAVRVLFQVRPLEAVRSR